MQRLWLDYQRPSPAYRWPGITLLTTAAVASTLLIFQYVVISQETEQRSQHIARLKREIERHRLFESSAEAQASNPDSGATKADARSAAHWEALFATLEAAADDSVTLLSIDTGADGITLTGEAKNLAAATAYVKRLQSAAMLTKVHLTEQGMLKEHPQHPTRFTALAAWKAAS